MIVPDYSRETALCRRGLARIAGVDEVGRGPWAGPVTAAAVVLNPGAIPQGLRDSKTLSPKRREALAEAILATSDVSVVHVSVEDIDRLNILQASHLAMRLAIAGLTCPPDHALIDGNRLPGDLPCPGGTIVRGDALSLSIAAASIVAKVGRDRLMVDLAQQHPDYGWATNMGYGTAEHRLGLERHGVSPHHRRSFKPIHNILWQEKNRHQTGI